MNIGMVDQAAARRGHSLARGTILAVALLGFAAFEAPMWIAGSATHAAPQAASNQAQGKQPPKQAKDSASAQSTPAPTTPASSTGAPPPNTGGSTSEPPKQAGPSEAAPQDGEWHRMTGTPAPTTPSIAPPPANAPAQPAAIPSAELRTQFNELSIRANSANSRLQSFQEQQARQGLSLRADIREAQARMDLQMRESATALDSGNVDAARQSIRYAQNAVETIEKFLGR